MLSPKTIVHLEGSPVDYTMAQLLIKVAAHNGLSTSSYFRNMPGDHVNTVIETIGIDEEGRVMANPEIFYEPEELTVMEWDEFVDLTGPRFKGGTVFGELDRNQAMDLIIAKNTEGKVIQVLRGRLWVNIYTEQFCPKSVYRVWNEDSPRLAHHRNWRIVQNTGRI